MSNFLDTIKENEGIIYKLVKIYAENDHDQQDLYQDIMYQLWKSYNTFQGNSKISTWIYRVALNTSLAHLKLKKKHSGKISIRDIELQIEYKTDAGIEDKVAEMYRQIRTLNEIDKAIIFLFLEGKNYEEIAAITGFTTSNIGTRLNRIKQKLKNQIVNQ